MGYAKMRNMSVPSLKRLKKHRMSPLIKIKKIGGFSVRLVKCPWRSSIKFAVILRRYGNK